MTKADWRVQSETLHFDVAVEGLYARPAASRNPRSAHCPIRRRKIRPIDHVVLPTTTLTLARARLTSLGFTVTPDARHSFGTGNCLVLFRNRTYLEPITILDRNKADMAAAEGVVFVKRVKRFTERQGEGFAMVVLKSKDAEADAAAFAKAGAGGSAAFRFSRQARLSDGSEREVSFAVAFADFAAARDATFFVCQHLTEDVLYQPAYIEHPNGAEGIAAVVAVAQNPNEFEGVLTTATDIPQATAIDSGVTAEAEGQALLILTPDAFRARYEVDAPNPRRGLLFAALEVTVADMARAGRYAGNAAKRQEDRIVVPAAPGLGTVIAFRRALDA